MHNLFPEEEPLKHHITISQLGVVVFVAAVILGLTWMKKPEMFKFPQKHQAPELQGSVLSAVEGGQEIFEVVPAPYGPRGEKPPIVSRRGAR